MPGEQASEASESEISAYSSEQGTITDNSGSDYSWRGSDGHNSWTPTSQGSGKHGKSISSPQSLKVQSALTAAMNTSERTHFERSLCDVVANKQHFDQDGYVVQFPPESIPELLKVVDGRIPICAVSPKDAKKRKLIPEGFVSFSMSRPERRQGEGWSVQRNTRGCEGLPSNHPNSNLLLALLRPDCCCRGGSYGWQDR